MKQNELALVVYGKLNVSPVETSDSGNSEYPLRASKRCRHDVPLARFKGVVPQPNGHWGAQVYANNQRVWLGTFKSEKEAAMAYDSAAIKLRSGDPHRNFPWTDLNIQEPNFQTLYTTDDVVNMIRDGSYQSKYADFLNISANRDDGGVLGNTNTVPKIMMHGDVKFSCMQLFQKDLTPSDVGKLNRLVIPKKYATKYFPFYNEKNGNRVVDNELEFYDKSMKIWTFRYCYWKSSQSFVLTRGWNKFIKEHKLKERDMLTFYKCDEVGEEINGRSFTLIEVNHNGGSRGHHQYHHQLQLSNWLNGEKPALLEYKMDASSSSSTSHQFGVELELNLGSIFNDNNKNKNINIQFDDDQCGGLKSPHNVEEERRITLFGVQLN